MECKIEELEDKFEESHHLVIQQLGMLVNRIELTEKQIKVCVPISIRITASEYEHFLRVGSKITARLMKMLLGIMVKSELDSE